MERGCRRSRGLALKLVISDCICRAAPFLLCNCLTLVGDTLELSLVRAVRTQLASILALHTRSVIALS